MRKHIRYPRPSVSILTDACAGCLPDRSLFKIRVSGPPRCALRPRKADFPLFRKTLSSGSARARARALNPNFRPPL